MKRFTHPLTSLTGKKSVGLMLWFLMPFFFLGTVSDALAKLSVSHECHLNCAETEKDAASETSDSEIQSDDDSVPDGGSGSSGGERAAQIANLPDTFRHLFFDCPALSPQNQKSQAPAFAAIRASFPPSFLLIHSFRE